MKKILLFTGIIAALFAGATILPVWSVIVFGKSDSGSTDLAFGIFLSYLCPFLFVLFLLIFIFALIIYYKLRNKRIKSEIDN
jgi:hypothetical protein